jgi:DNA polymerase-3 subunit delta'
MRFSDLQGLDDIKQRLIRSVKSGKVAHAQLFAGRAGAPNLPMALAYANYLNCEEPGEEDACGKCPSCLKNAKFIHPDLHFVFPVSGTKQVKSKDAISQVFLKEWRTFLSEDPHGSLEQWSAVYGGENKQVNISKEESRQIIRNLSLKAFEGKYKIMLIWLPEYFHPFAANGILKILEEPPERTVFLLVSNDPERLLGTILSRTQTVHIRNYSIPEITEILKAQNGSDPDRILQAAQIADGNLSQAVKLMDKVEADQHETFVAWMRKCYSIKEVDSLAKMADDFHRMSKLEQRSLIQYGLSMMRESLVARHAATLSRLPGSESSFVSRFSEFLSPDQIRLISEQFNDALYHLERNGSPKMTFLDTSLQIMEILKS